MSVVRVLVALIALSATAAMAQTAALRASAVQKSRIHLADSELLRLKEQPRVELQRLEGAQQAACRIPASAACKAATQRLTLQRPELLKKLNAGEAHVRSTKPGSSCQGCHAGPGSSAATDPMRGGLPGASGGGGSASSGGPTAGSTGGATSGPSSGATTGSSAGSTSGSTGGSSSGSTSGSSAGSRPGPPSGSTSSGTGSSGPPGGSTSAPVEPRVVRCFVATAAFGSPFADEVATLRSFRDRQLLTREAGRRFVALYEQWSPPLAAFIAGRDGLRAVVRGLLLPVVMAIESPRASLALLLAACATSGALALALAMRRRSPTAQPR